ncbi:MAG: HemK/PrmC family methyltransferase [Candidatus Daviesbacteria bacterium]
MANLSLSSKLCKKQKINKPEAYQKGWLEFYKLSFKVTPDVLIPRPETELLVDNVLQFIKQLLTNNHQPITILDLGTGSGNIAISIAKNSQRYLTSGVRVQIIATDISKQALQVAQLNAKFHGVEKQIKFIRSDLLSYFNTRLYYSEINPDIIVTNLPYIPTERIPYLDSSVKDFEPKVALDGGVDGFKLYRKLFAQIKKKNWKPKLFVGEIDYTHGELAKCEALKYFPDAEVEVKTDLAHKQRILTLKLSHYMNE